MITRAGSWKANLLHYLGVFFGETSAHYKFVDDMYFKSKPFFNDDDKIIFDTSKRELNIFLDNCINAIKNTGIKKKEWRHYLLTQNPSLAWTIGVAVLLFTFWLGTKFADNKSNDASNENAVTKNESVHKLDLSVKKKSTETDKPKLDTTKR